MKTWIAALGFTTLSLSSAYAEGFEFASIDGGSLSLDQYQGGPVLIVNTASECGFTPQYAGMQELYETYKDQGLTVLAIPSDDFKQELASAEDVKDFCDAQFDLTFPMTDITHVKGSQSHPFYQWVKSETGFEPKWNFFKILLDGDGKVAQTYTSFTAPSSNKIKGDIEKLLPAQG